jgi:hypothetical protein
MLTFFSDFVILKSVFPLGKNQTKKFIPLDELVNNILEVTEWRRIN